LPTGDVRQASSTSSALPAWKRTPSASLQAFE
jgi:hypothetical protein